jgi:hypothetical protein
VRMGSSVPNNRRSGLRCLEGQGHQGHLEPVAPEPAPGVFDTEKKGLARHYSTIHMSIFELPPMSGVNP